MVNPAQVDLSSQNCQLYNDQANNSYSFLINVIWQKDFTKGFTFIFVCVLTHVCARERHVYTGACRDQKKVLGSHELELLVFTRHMADVLGRKLTLVPESKIFSTPFLEVPISYLEIPFLVA